MEKFRRALSLAADREEINNILFHGVGLIKSAVPQRGHPFYPGDDVANIWVDYDPSDGQPDAGRDPAQQGCRGIPADVQR